MDHYEEQQNLIDEDLSAQILDYAMAHVVAEDVYAALPQLFTPGGKVRKNPEYDASRTEKSAIERAMVAAKVQLFINEHPHAQIKLFLRAGVMHLSTDIAAFMVREHLFVDMAMKGWQFTAEL